MLTEPYKLTRHCEVTAILILYGLPRFFIYFGFQAHYRSILVLILLFQFELFNVFRLLTGSILAHEMMHAWLRLNGDFSHLSVHFCLIIFFPATRQHAVSSHYV